MNPAHVHLALTHAPLFAIIIAAGLLAVGLWRNSSDIIVAGLVLAVIAGLVTIPVYLTGEPAEEIVEGMPGVSHQAIEAHESAGKVTLILALLAGATGVAALALRNRASFRHVAAACLVVGIITCAAAAWTANLGGMVHHPEIAGSTAGAQGQSGSDEHRDHDRD